MLAFIRTGTTGVVQTFGKFNRVVKPGIHAYMPFFQKITPISNLISINEQKIQLRTFDNVFPTIDLAIQFQIKEEDTYRACFSCDNFLELMSSNVDHVVRVAGSRLTLDQLCASQEDIAKAVMFEVSPVMQQVGITLIDTKVRNVSPPTELMVAMNNVNASERRRSVARNEAEALKTQKIMEAEADAIRKELQGKGLASMRDAIMTGWSASISKMAKELGIPEQEITKIMLQMLHLDTLAEIGRNSATKTIFLNPPDGSSSIRTAMMQAMEATANGK